MIPFLADLFGSTSGVAAVYGQQDAGDVPGVIAREKQRRGSAILRTYHLPVGLEARGILHIFLGARFERLRVIHAEEVRVRHGAGADGVAADAERGALDRNSLRDLVDRALRRAV